ncbi:hypothetical protein MKW98_012720 [Papaver atlanticum]|uniref:Protein kinase domain-containing protein n=1 Tax=Papaver atlanticum TaxID=357466 RepID=A0AAD4SVK6_9MAGN|nr:hypothetical protein MKW98_012720 [Papaver atlanticum]
MVNIIFADRSQDQDHYDQLECDFFTLKVIKAATQNFNPANVIRKDWDRYGDVTYKGVLPNGIAVEVRQISTDTDGTPQYLKKISYYLALRHQNIIRLLGHYSDKRNILLVYEHMESGDLQTALFDDVKLKKSLNWKTRVKICLGIAKGLAFLHQKDQSKTLIVHRDVKPRNILLDKYLNPKISDFNFARLCQGEVTHYVTKVAGTFGYLDPEYLVKGTINDKTDVYGFGVLIIALLGGKRPFCGIEGSEYFHLPSVAQELKENGNLFRLIDEDLNMQYSVKEATMILKLAILCTSETRKLRPTMSEVVSILEGRTTMKTPVVDPLSSAVVNSEVVISIVESNSTSKETELTDEGFASNLDYLFSKLRETSVSSEVASVVTEENDNPEFVEYGSKQTVGIDETESLDFRRIEVATNNFSLANKIGQGSSGSVYRGMLPNGKIVAVKQLLMTSDQGKQDFQNEGHISSSLKHPNLVRMLWHCTGNNQHCLVYEYMENGSLYGALFENVKEKLAWPARDKICIGVAKGLSFLHDDDSKYKIVHRDIKLSNILLDKDLTPKISDFGLAMHYNREVTHINTGLAGTVGCMAPEYVILGTVTEKIDVYSFGIVTLELITGKKRVEWISDHESVSLLDLVYDLQQKGDILGVIDQDLKMNIPVKEAEMMLSLGMLCKNPDPNSRPSMSEVVSILEGRTMIKTSTPSNLHGRSRIDSTMDSAAISVHNLTSTSTHRWNVFSSSNVYHHNDGLPTKEYRNGVEFHHDFVSDGWVSFDNAKLDYISLGDCPPISDDRPQASPAYEVSPKREYKYVEPFLTDDGKLQIMCTDEEFEAGCREWKNSLVGFFVGDNVHFVLDINMVRKLWEVNGDVSVVSMDNGYFIFQFSYVEDKIRVLQSADLWQIQQRPMILREWDWKLKFNRIEEMESLPIWVKIYNLPLFLWTPSFLSKIGSGLGIPLFADQKTKNRERLAYAMLCVEVSAQKLLPESLDIMVKGMEYELKLEYGSSQIAAPFDRKNVD